MKKSSLFKAAIAICFLGVCAALLVIIKQRLSFFALPPGIELGMSADAQESIVGPPQPVQAPLYRPYSAWQDYEFWFAPPMEVGPAKDERFGLAAVTKKYGEKKVFILPENLRGQLCGGRFYDSKQAENEAAPSETPTQSAAGIEGHLDGK